MIDMKIQNSGLNVELSDSRELFIEGTKLTADVRTLAQMRPVLCGPVDLPDTTPVYEMYREACKPVHRELYASKQLRYDITVVPPLMLGTEFNKTLGHYHPPSARPGLSFPELYEVLHGTAHYLLQQPAEGFEGVQRVILVECHEGDKVLIPPNFGHVTINMGSEVLVMDNLVERNFSSVYAPYVKNKGGAYYVTEDGDKANRSFEDVPELETYFAPDFNRMVNPDIAEPLDVDLSYGLFENDPDFFKFLVDPKDVELKS